MENEGGVIAPGGFYYMFADSFYKEASEKVPKEAQSLIPFELYLRSENGKQYAATYFFGQNGKTAFSRFIPKPLPSGNESGPWEPGNRQT